MTVCGGEEEQGGLSNIYIDCLLRKTAPARYRGTFSCNNIPIDIAHLPYFSIICNLAKAGERGSHFVTLVGQPDQIIYIDPLAMPCTNPDITKFINDARSLPQGGERRQRYFRHQVLPIQNRLSKYCGFYCIMYVLFYERDNHIIMPTFDMQNLWANDSRCLRYIKLFIVSNPK